MAGEIYDVSVIDIQNVSQYNSFYKKITLIYGLDGNGTDIDAGFS